MKLYETIEQFYSRSYWTPDYVLVWDSALKDNKALKWSLVEAKNYVERIGCDTGGIKWE